jgi:hypothetical protein
MDMYAVSSHDKDPDRALKLNEEIEEAKCLIQRIKNAVPKKCETVYLMGNHETRLARFLKLKAPALFKMKSLELPTLLELDALSVTTLDYGVPYVMPDGVLVVHGDVASSKGGYTANRMLERYGTSGISGHCHRLAMVQRTYQPETRFWIEGGCLCRLDPEYAITPVNWQHGFVVVEEGITSDKYLPIPITGENRDVQYPGYPAW